MMFKVGDKVRFKKFKDLPTHLKNGSPGQFHSLFDRREAIVIKTFDNAFLPDFTEIDRIMVDIDTSGQFIFRTERFEKAEEIKLELDNDLFQL